jgi:hypothetical protein
VVGERGTEDELRKKACHKKNHNHRKQFCTFCLGADEEDSPSKPFEDLPRAFLPSRHPVVFAHHNDRPRRRRRRHRPGHHVHLRWGLAKRTVRAWKDWSNGGPFGLVKRNDTFSVLAPPPKLACPDTSHAPHLATRIAWRSSRTTAATVPRLPTSPSPTPNGSWVTPRRTR